MTTLRNPPVNTLDLPVEPTLRAVGDGALLVEFGGELLAANHRVRAVHQTLKAHPPAGLLDLTPAYTTLLLTFDPLVLASAEVSNQVLVAWHAANEAATSSGRVVEIPVRYGGVDGPDLPDVARHTGLSEAEVVALHATPAYSVLFLGFMPGFPYLHGLDARLSTPRLATPRQRVPAGSVGIGGDQTGIHAMAAPTGWRIIGRTPLTLYNPHSDSLTLLQPGDTVRFVVL